jgi:hypothetical protein
VKEKVKAMAESRDTSITKVVLDALDVYWVVLEG